MKEQYGPTMWWERVRGRAPEVVQFHRYYLESGEPGERLREAVPVVEPGAYEDFEIIVVESLRARLERLIERCLALLAPATA